MYFMIFKSFVFSGLSRDRCTYNLSVLKSSLFVVGITDGVLSYGKSDANLSSVRCKTDTGEGNHCH